MTALDQLDVAYVVRPGNHNDELRHSLRSVVANLPHRTVTLAGHSPKWARYITALERDQPDTKYLNALTNLRAILARYELTDDVILMNDDHFVVEPVNNIPWQYTGPLVEFIRDLDRQHTKSPYRLAQHDTLYVLQRMGFHEPLNYARHVPVIVNRAALRTVLTEVETVTTGWPAERRAILSWRTIYGTITQQHTHGATQADDVKVWRHHHVEHCPTPFVSTSDSSFQHGAIGRHLRQMFPNLCPYERS
jgi:hypothetical protein